MWAFSWWKSHFHEFLSPIAQEGAIWTLPVPIIFFYSCYFGTSRGQWWKFIQHDMSILHTTYSFDHKRDDVTASSWQNHAIINASFGRMLVMVESTYVSVKIRFYASPWWRHQMETISALLTLCGEFTGHRWIPLTRPVTRSFDVFFYLRLNKRLCKQSRRRWFQTPSRSL